MKKNIYLIFICFSTMLNAQETRWFQCFYYNRATSINKLYTPTIQLDKFESKQRLLIAVDQYGLTFYFETGQVNYYKSKQSTYTLDNGKNIATYDGVNRFHEKYQIGITAPIGLWRNKFDSIILTGTESQADLYGVKMLFKIDEKKQIGDDFLNLKIDSFYSSRDNISIIPAKNESKSILISKSNKLQLGDKYFVLRLIRGNKNNRHYLLVDNGAELLITENQKTIKLFMTQKDGTLLKYFCNR